MIRSALSSKSLSTESCLVSPLNSSLRRRVVLPVRQVYPQPLIPLPPCYLTIPERVAQSGIPQLPSFSTPGYGKEKPRPPASSSSHTHSSNEAIDINPYNSTSPTSANSIPYKRLSSDLAPVLSNSPKRPRIASPSLEKENVFSAFQKGKEREGQTPPPSQHYAQGSLSEATPSTSVHPQSVQTSRRAAVASRSFVYNHKTHTDLQSVIFVLSSFVLY